MSQVRPRAVRLLAGWVAATVLLTSGCAAGSPATAPSTPPPVPAAAPTAEAPDLRQFVIAAVDIPLPGFLPPTVRRLDVDEVEGVEAFFDSEDGLRQLGETIVVLPDADAARTAVQGAAETIADERPGATVSPATAGDTAVIVTGAEQDGIASTLLLFSQGTASVVMDFRGPASDPTPPDTVIEAGVRQAALLSGAFG